MRRLFNLLLFTLLLSPLNSYGQNKEWGLDECIEYAIENNIDLKSKKLDIETGRVNLSESKWAYAPNISLNNSSNISQGRVLDPTTYVFTENETVQGNNTSVSASLTLFNGMRNMHNRKKSELGLRSSILGVEKAENDLTLNLTAYYLEVLLAKENIRNAEQIVVTLEIQRESTKKMVEAQKVTTADLLQIESQLADAQTNLLTAKNRLYVAKLNICQLLEIEDYMSFETIVSDDVLTNPSELPQRITPILHSAESLPEMKMAQLGIDVAKSDLSVARANYYPTISLSAAYGSSYSSARQKAFQNPDGTYRYEAYSFAEQYRDNFNSYLSIGISVPIFSGFTIRKNVQRQKIVIRQAEYSLLFMGKQIAREVNQAYIDMNIAWDKYHSTQIYVTSAKEAAEHIERKYNLGAATIVDYNTVLNNLVDASSKHLQAKYEYIFKTRIIKFYLQQ